MARQGKVEAYEYVADADLAANGGLMQGPKTKINIENLATAAVPDASETVKGKAELATVAEAVAGVDTTRIVTPAGLAAAITALGGLRFPVVFEAEADLLDADDFFDAIASYLSTNYSFTLPTAADCYKTFLIEVESFGSLIPITRLANGVATAEYPYIDAGATVLVATIFTVANLGDTVRVWGCVYTPNIVP